MEEGEDFGDAEGLLEVPDGLAGGGGMGRAGFDQVAGHVDEGGLRRGKGAEDALGGRAPTAATVVREVQIAEKDIIGVAGAERERALSRVDAQSTSKKPDHTSQSERDWAYASER